MVQWDAVHDTTRRHDPTFPLVQTKEGTTDGRHIGILPVVPQSHSRGKKVTDDTE